MTGDFYGLPTEIITNEWIKLEYLTTAGPRIVRFGWKNGANLLAELPDFQVPTPLGKYSFRGGHRLWRSPEIMPETYMTDDSGLAVHALPDGVRLSQREPDGIQKDIEIRMAPDRAEVILVHTIHNLGKRAVTLSPWALTMLKGGGTAILPQPTGNSDPLGYLHNRVIALWPYTRMNDARLTWRDDFVLIQADAVLPPLKIGYFNKHGWLAYWLDGTLFRKSYTVDAGARYPDGGCNAESYCNDRFIELESLGPLVELRAGEATTLTETWQVFSDLDQPFLPEEISKLVQGRSKPAR